jgi:hypothetical protein
MPQILKPYAKISVATCNTWLKPKAVEDGKPSLPSRYINPHLSHEGVGGMSSSFLYSTVDSLQPPLHLNPTHSLPCHNRN